MQMYMLNCNIFDTDGFKYSLYLFRGCFIEGIRR